MPGPEVLVPLLVAAFLVGSLPFGFWLCRWLRGVDIRTVGSGNVGATNVWRCMGARLGLTVFVLDVLKGAVPAYVGVRLGGQVTGVLAGVAAMLGHSFSPFLRFRGGKGVATTLGVLIGVTPLTAALTFGFWLVVTLLTRYVSLASMLACVFAITFVVARREDPVVIALFSVLGLVIVVRHRANLRRLLRGEEPKFRFGSGGEKAPE